MKVVIYGESGQYCTLGLEVEVETSGTDLAIKRLLAKYAKKWGDQWDNWGGWHDAKTVCFRGTMEEFLSKYPSESEPHYITGCTYRLNVMDDLCTDEKGWW